MKNLHLSTINLGLWWEGVDIVDVLRTLLYELGMPAERLKEIIRTESPEQDDAGSTVVADWRTVEKHKSGLTQENSLYAPKLHFNKLDPPWVQHWIFNALGTVPV